ncbi:2-phospho-L-lactate guanylyltransferase [Nitriliruptor alkaliphilus]|uniref:2-phospho-L-lactate guanylyltransferase n=1 Tax=Nitriliruptor alkaliphilus TaxID=427918 RepID=UPI000696B409|nr:2-phospho-L-lactate guanylyltransferase [Nitriliruptor alkaliphilus]
MSSSPRAATVALVPLRAPGVGKSRLAGTLSVEGRAALAGAMLADVAAALRSSPVDRIVVAAGGPTAIAAASALGLEALADPVGASGLDGALAAAAGRLGPVGTLVVVAADLPCLCAEDVTALLGHDAEVVVAPTSDGGTGALLRRPPDACPTAYGPGSGLRHLALARAAGRRTAEAALAGFAHDVDVAEDLVRLTAADLPPLGARTAALLDQLDIAVAG